jgi:DNA-binding MarR family transcriptional regulator
MALVTDLRVLVGGLRRRLRQETQVEAFTWSQASALLRLEQDGPATVTALAQAEGVRPQSMGATIAVLEAAGLVSGAPDPTDGRRTILSLTDACREMAASNRAAKENWLFRAIQTKLDPEAQETLAAGLVVLRRLIEA